MFYAQDDLYRHKPFYLVTCQRPTANISLLEARKKVKDNIIKLQVAKYVDTIVKHCLTGAIGSARLQAELVLNYMDRNWYRPLNVVNALFEVFGLAIYLVNQDVPKWSDELNAKRIMFILSSFDDGETDAYKNFYHESYFGPQVHYLK